MSEANQSSEEASWSLGLAEFFCGMVVVLAPILTWGSGPAVSTDQFVVRVSVFVVALTGALGIRGAKRRRASRRSGNT